MWHDDTESISQKNVLPPTAFTSDPMMEDIPTRMEHDLVGDLCVVCTYLRTRRTTVSSLIVDGCSMLGGEDHEALRADCVRAGQPVWLFGSRGV
jgi:hypothetical protein